MNRHQVHTTKEPSSRQGLLLHNEALALCLTPAISVKVFNPTLQLLLLLLLFARCRGFLALESRSCGFLVLESRCRGFLSSEKTPWNHDVVAYLSPFLDVVAFWSWNLDVVVFWSWNLDVMVFWSWDLDVMVYASTFSFSFSASFLFPK